MIRPIRRNAAFAATAFALLVSLAAAQTEPRYKELPNFHRVNERLYRGAQPENGGIRKLAELGVKTVVNLRGEDEQARIEKREAEAAGMRYVSISMPGLSRPTDAQIAQAIAVIDAPENGPVFVHCKRGSDRTGTVIAVYRITHEGWTGERALDEARHFGLSWVEVGMKNYISDTYRRVLRSKQTASDTSSN